MSILFTYDTVHTKQLNIFINCSVQHIDCPSTSMTWIWSYWG